MAYEYSLHSVKQPNFKEALVVFKHSNTSKVKLKYPVSFKVQSLSKISEVS